LTGYGYPKKINMSLQDDHGLMSAGGTPSATLRTDEMTLIQSVSDHGILTHGVAAACAATVLLHIEGVTAVVIWLLCIFSALAIRYVLYLAYKRAAADLRADQYWALIVAASNFLIGASWGGAGYLFFAGSHNAAEITLILAIAVAAASAQTISPTRETLAALLAPMLLPLAAKFLLIDYASYAAPSVLAFVLLLSMWFSIGRYRALLAASIDGYEQRSASDAAMIRGAETANRLFAQVVTERERAEAELTIAKQAADDANQAKGDFLAYTSHEIRTPLTAVIGFSDALLASQQTPVQQDYSRRIKGASERLLTLINDLLDLSKIEAGKLNIEYADFELRQTLDEVVHEQGVKAREKEITVELVVDSNVPDALMGDSLRLRQILLNLIGNAIKFTPARGKVTARVRVIESAGDASRLAFSVTDTGIGIPADKLETMFQRYTQADASTARKYGGTGLGLSICKSLVELMEGKIGVHSEAGKGSDFWFELPFKMTASTDKPADFGADEPAPTPAPKPASAQAFKGMRVLVAEDNENNQMLIELLLKRQGVETKIVGDGAEAVAHLRDNQYDLVLMDLEMPVMGGLEAVAAIREQEKMQGRRSNIVALSAHSPEQERGHCIAAGMDDYMMKPIDVKVLHAFLRKFAPARITAIAEK
jgi:signal transduction histidine kinase/ActR/RegA family two-component response regulator